MKKLTQYSAATLFLIFVIISAQAQTTSYGDELSDSKAVKTTKLDKVMDGKEVLSIKLEGEISEVCQSKGCWMTVNTGDGQTMRVTFKDYGFFVAKDAAGKKAVFEGEAKMETVDVATLKHYAEDAGKSEEEVAAINEPETKLIFVATGVEIK